MRQTWGNMVYISNWIEEATEIRLENQEKSENTRIFVEDKLANTEAVGISALIVNDQKQKTSRLQVFLGKGSCSFWRYWSKVAIHTFQAHIFGRGCYS